MMTLVEWLTYSFFGLVFIGLPMAFALLAVLHFLMPREVTDHYWRPPHFTPSEVVFFDAGIWRLFRTSKLVAALGVDSIARKRRMHDAAVRIPRWYRVVARAACLFYVMVVVLMLLNMPALYACLVAAGQAPSPSEFSLQGKIALAVFLCCAVLLAVQWWRARKRR